VSWMGVADIFRNQENGRSASIQSSGASKLNF
jgi:hypothetical protein